MFIFLFVDYLCFTCFFFFFNDTATTEIYTLSLHDALPISLRLARRHLDRRGRALADGAGGPVRSEEHTSELQSHSDLVCRLLLEKKKKPVRNANDCREIPVENATIH